MTTPHILIADDQEDILETLQLTLKNEGWRCTSARDPRAVLRQLQESAFDLVLMDLNYERDTTSGQEGLELLESIRQLEAAPPVVVMTAWGSVELAVEALRLGARDFIEKPWDNLRLCNVLRAQLDLQSSRQQSERLSASNAMLTGAVSKAFVAESPVMQSLLETLSSIAASDASVLILGENGTGKNQLAAMLHRQSLRAGQSMVTMDMGAITETLFESELFGHTKGAFTDARETKIGRLELADGGSLFLDEIANMGPAQQTRLLRVLETGEFERVGSSQTRRSDIRFISATNADIEQLIEEGEFRRDLYYRLNTVILKVPALRERPEDIEPLATHFLAQHAARYRKPDIQFKADALKALHQHNWPGNIRELAHAVERAVLVCTDDLITTDHLGLNASSNTNKTSLMSLMTIDEMEQQLIEHTLQQHDFNISQCANSLGISRSSLYRKMEAFGLSVP